MLLVLARHACGKTNFKEQTRLNDYCRTCLQFNLKAIEGRLLNAFVISPHVDCHMQRDAGTAYRVSTD